MIDQTIENISVCEDISLITLHNLEGSAVGRAGILSAIAKKGINIDMISSSPDLGSAVNLSFSLSDADLPSALEVISEFKKSFSELETSVCSGNIALSFFGIAMAAKPGVAAGVLCMLENSGIEVILITTSDVSISALVPGADKVKVLRLTDDK